MTKNLRNILKYLLLLIMALVSTESRAYIIGELKYNILSAEDKTVDVSLAYKVSSYTQISNLVIPSAVEIEGVEYQVVAIAKRAFTNVYRVLNSIEVPSSVKVIGAEAFSGLKNVDEIKLHEGLDSIGDKAFYQSSIKMMEIPSSVKVIGKSAFAELKNIDEIKLHDGLNSIGNKAFYQSSIKMIEIPSSVKVIGNEAFSELRNVEEIILHEGLDSIGYRAFYHSSIKKIKMPSTASRLGKQLFCLSDLQEVEWPETLHKIPSGCFSWTDLSFFDFSKIKEIGSSAFIECELREEVVIPSGCSIGLAAFKYCKIKHLTFEELPQEIPLSSENRTFLDDFSFAYATLDTKRLVLPRGLLINRLAFMDCSSVRTIELHEGVGFKGLPVFCGVMDVLDSSKYLPTWIPDSIIYIAKNPHPQFDVFQEVMYEESTLYVEPEALEKARKTTPWSKFRKIEALSTGVEDIRAESAEGNEDEEYIYTLEGVLCGSDRNVLSPGIYIVRRNGQTSKIII